MDPWVITPQERARFEVQFNALKPINGIVTGGQARDFFLQSQLPAPVLGIIWGLADTDADGKMNINEFSIACKLINLKLRGFDMPQALPPNMLQFFQPAAVAPGVPASNAALLSGMVPPPKPPLPAAPSPIPAAASKIISPPSGGGTPNLLSPTGILSPPLVAPSPAPLVTAPLVSAPLIGGGVPPPIPPAPVVPLAGLASVTPPSTIGIPSMTAQPLAGIVPTVNGAAPIPAAVVPGVPPVERVGSIESPLASGSPLVEWSVPHPSKLKYTQLFNTTDRTRSGYLSGVQARNIMVASQLPQPVLAQIWGLSDMDADGKLSCEEFVLAMHLCDLARSGEKIPVPLPPDLIPPTLRRQRQNSVNSEQGDPLAGISQVTFEDKRKENYEKGQAELDRRRKALLEIQRKEQEERERKEREEQEKKEKIRLEQERRRQQEFEKQLQMQRELEQQREEERRRAQEQREAARREMERQRQLEMEKARSQELQAQRQREQETVLKLKAHNQNLSIELSQLNEKVKELSQKISETRSGVTSVKTTIDGMRSTRDTQLSEMSQLKAKLKEHNTRLVAISQEKARLEARNKMNLAGDAASQEQAKIAFNNKQIALKQMRDKIQDMEKEIELKLEDIENNNTQLSDLKSQLGSLITDCEQIYVVYDEKRNAIVKMKGGRTQDMSAGWGNEAWDAAPAAWPEDNIAPEPGYRKYRALYEFVARNGDELSFQPGDIIMVPLEQNAEPGWLAGELRGATGWFPESYVELIDTATADGQMTAAETEAMQKRHLEGIAEVPENISDNGSAVLEVAASSGGDAGGAQGPAVGEMPSLVLGLGTAVELTVVALYNFAPSDPRQLAFAKGDQFEVTENQDKWWYGSVNGAEGWFPKNYVKLATEPVAAVQAATIPAASDGAIPEDQQEYYVSLYPYQSEEAGDLSFKQGEVMLVVKMEGDWWTGVIGDRTGIFPSNYVQKADQQVQQPVVPTPIEEPVVERKESLPVQMEPPQEIQPARSPAAEVAALTAQSTKGGKKPEIATVIAPYQATSTEQLSLQRGQLIMIRKKTTTGWWEGELQAKGKKRQIGWFPASYVKTLGGGGTGRTTPLQCKTPDPMPPVDNPGAERVIAQYQYVAQNEDELSFDKDDIIVVVSRDEPSWWRGELRGATGLFPSNYVTPL